MKLLTFLKILLRAFCKNDEWSRYFLAEKITGIIYPKYKFSEFGRMFLEDDSIIESYERFDKSNYHSLDRKYFLRNLIGLINDLPGDTAECGVFQGASSYLICSEMDGKEIVHHVIDSFEGLSSPESIDGLYWDGGNLCANLNLVKQNLAEFDFVKYHKGWIPESFSGLEGLNFSFVHIDVDLYQPTLDSLKFFYKRMVSGGVMLCDDYGFYSCPGAKKAMDEFFSNKVERIINVPTGQAFVVKR